jgi:hypothetical protein
VSSSQCAEVFYIERGGTSTIFITRERTRYGFEFGLIGIAAVQRRAENAQLMLYLTILHFF